MKISSRLIHCLVIVIAFLAISNYSKSQSSSQKREGEVVYTSSFTTGMGDMKQQIDIVFKGDKQVVTMDITTQAGKMTTLNYFDAKENQKHSYMNVGGKKYEVEMTKEETSQAWQSNPATAMFNPDSMNFNFKPVDSTINVLGHTCRKYAGGKTGLEMEVYACDSLYIPSGSLNPIPGGQQSGQGMFTGVKGGVLKYIMKMNILGMDIQSTVTAVKLSYSPVKDSEFKLPKGYKKVTYKEFQDELMKQYMKSK